MNIKDFFPNDLAGIAILIGAALSILNWIMRKEIAEPIARVQKSNEELARVQRESNEANMERFDAIDKTLDHHEIELTRHREQIVALSRQDNDR